MGKIRVNLTRNDQMAHEMNVNTEELNFLS